MKKLLYFIFIICIFFLPNLSKADDTQVDIQGSDINVETIPSNPQPYQDVTINLSSYATDLNRAIITWQEQSGASVSGIGKTSYSFTAGGPNTTDSFVITITPVGSTNSITKNVKINPSEIEILWESVDGYAPPFYKGKILPTIGSSIKTVAIPNTNTIKAGIGSFSYTWKNDDNVVQDASGYNKNSYIFKTSIFDNTNKIEVLASSVDGNYSADQIINIPDYDPKIIFYKKSPTEGILYNNALDEKSLFPEDEISIVAEPYFLALNNNDSVFDYTWSVNNNPIETPAKKTEITIRPTERNGYAILGLVIEDSKELFQKVTGQLKMTL